VSASQKPTEQFGFIARQTSEQLSLDGSGCDHADVGSSSALLGQLCHDNPAVHVLRRLTNEPLALERG
jgi:hypothetical protein